MDERVAFGKLLSHQGTIQSDIAKSRMELNQVETDVYVYLSLFSYLILYVPRLSYLIRPDY